METNYFSSPAHKNISAASQNKLHFYIQSKSLKWAQNYFPLVYVELEPGDVLFFHCNLLHSSAPNESEFRRWVLISSFNKKLNNPMIQHFCPSYHPLNILPNDAILAYQGQKSSIDKEFHSPTYGKWEKGCVMKHWFVPLNKNFDEFGVIIKKFELKAHFVYIFLWNIQFFNKSESWESVVCFLDGFYRLCSSHRQFFFLRDFPR